MSPMDLAVPRIIFATPFAIFGLLHLLNGPTMAPMVPMAGGTFWIYFTGVCLIAGSLGIMTRVLGSYAALGLAILMLVFIVAIHIPGLADEARQEGAIQGLLKDTGLMGGALTWFTLLRYAERTKERTGVEAPEVLPPMATTGGAARA